MVIGRSHMIKYMTVLNSAQKMCQNDIQHDCLISAVVFVLFRKYISVVEIMNQSINQSKMTLFPEMIKNDS